MDSHDLRTRVSSESTRTHITDARTQYLSAMRMRSLKALSSSLGLASSLYYRAGVLYSRRRRRSNTSKVSDHACTRVGRKAAVEYLLRERGVFVGELLGVVPEFINGVEQRTQVNCTRPHTKHTQHDTHGTTHASPHTRE